MDQNFSIQGISSTRYTALTLAAIEKFGAKVDGNTGSGSKDGIELSWTYNPTTATIYFSVVKKPFFVSLTQLKNQVNYELLNGGIQ